MNWELMGRSVAQHLEDERKRNLTECRQCMNDLIEIRAYNKPFEEAKKVYEHAFFLLLKKLETEWDPEWDL